MIFRVNALGPLDLDHAVLHCRQWRARFDGRRRSMQDILVRKPRSLPSASVTISRELRRGPRGSLQTHTFFAGQPTALFSLAYTVSQDCPPAHILECPCPTRPFQCEMDVFQGPCLDPGVARRIDTPLTRPRTSKAPDGPQRLGRNSNCSRGRRCGLLASGWHKSGDLGRFLEGDGSSIKG